MGLPKDNDMPVIEYDNLMAAHKIYRNRLRELKNEVQDCVARGELLGPKYEKETWAMLDKIEKELPGVEDCLRVIKSLLAEQEV